MAPKMHLEKDGKQPQVKFWNLKKSKISLYHPKLKLGMKEVCNRNMMFR